MADEYDVIIVGSGAGGGTLAHRLAPSDTRVLILERGLSPTEEAQLIEQTMRELDQDSFIGIEMQSYGMDNGANFLQRVVMGGPRPRMAVIGPADLLKLVSKDNEQIVTKIIAKEE